MLPALIYRAVLVAGLSVILVAAIAWPVRHVLVPMWPGPVEERLYRTVDGNIVRQFSAVGQEIESPHQLVARHRPVNLLIVETVHEQPMLGFPAGVRDGSGGELMEQLPEWITGNRMVPPVDSVNTLIIETVDEALHEVPANTIRYMYRPNRLPLMQRMALTFDRFLWAISRDQQMRAFPHEPALSAEAPEMR